MVGLCFESGRICFESGRIYFESEGYTHTHTHEAVPLSLSGCLDCVLNHQNAVALLSFNSSFD